MPSCKGLRQEVIDCILSSDCVIKQKKSLKECFRGDRELADREGPGADGVPEKCRQLQRGHLLCVKSMVRAWTTWLAWSMAKVDGNVG
jgi:cytochrome c oxidase assembly factor 5